MVYTIPHMKNKWIIPLLACCVGILIGWFTGRIGLRPVPVLEGEAPTSRMEGERLEGEAPTSRTESDVPSLVNDPSPDDDLPTRHGIILQQSADETRQAIIENANLNEIQTAQLDTLIADMNRQMLDVSTKWADHIRATGRGGAQPTLDINTRLKMQHDINGVSVAFSDKMDAEFPGWRGDNTDLTRLVRVTVAFEPFRKVRGEILRNEIGGRGSDEPLEGERPREPEDDDE